LDEALQQVLEAPPVDYHSGYNKHDPTHRAGRRNEPYSEWQIGGDTYLSAGEQVHQTRGGLLFLADSRVIDEHWDRTLTRHMLREELPIVGFKRGPESLVATHQNPDSFHAVFGRGFAFRIHDTVQIRAGLTCLSAFPVYEIVNILLRPGDPPSPSGAACELDIERIHFSSQIFDSPGRDAY
jgi:hypothetical protein